MRIKLWVVVAGLALGSPLAKAESAKNFIVTIDGVDYAIDAGEKLTVKGKSGADFQLGLKQNDIGTFHGDFASFQLAKGQAVTSSQVQAGVKQHMLATNKGTLVLVQEYADSDPRSLVDFALKQLSKDDVRDGGDIEKKPSKRANGPGAGLEGVTGKISVKKSGGQRIVRYEVEAGGTADHGIVAVSRIDSEAGADDQKLVDRFWDTLAVKY